MMKFNQTFLVMLFSMMLVLVACGKGDNSSNSESVLDKIEENKKMVVGVDATFKPFEFMENDEIVGFNIDLLNAIGKELGADEVEFISMEFDGLIPGILAGKIDMSGSAMFATDERRETVGFSESYYPAGLGIMIRKEDIDEIKGIE